MAGFHLQKSISVDSKLSFTLGIQSIPQMNVFHWWENHKYAWDTLSFPSNHSSVLAEPVCGGLVRLFSCWSPILSFRPCFHYSLHPCFSLMTPDSIPGGRGRECESAYLRVLIILSPLSLRGIPLLISFLAAFTIFIAWLWHIFVRTKYLFFFFWLSKDPSQEKAKERRKQGRMKIQDCYKWTNEQKAWVRSYICARRWLKPHSFSLPIKRKGLNYVLAF